MSMRTLISVELDLYVFSERGEFYAQLYQCTKATEVLLILLYYFKFDIEGNQKFSILQNEYHNNNMLGCLLCLLIIFHIMKF